MQRSASGVFRWLITTVLLVAASCDRNDKRIRVHAGDVALVGATVVPMDREGVLRDHSVIVRGDRIALVAPAQSIDTQGATVIDARGKWIVPGLADMHVHVWSDKDFGLYLLNGVTTIRNMWGTEQHLAWRTALAAGTILGPTMFTTGPVLDGSPPIWPGSTIVDSADVARTVVKQQKEAGYDFIKVYTRLPLDAYNAIVTEATAQQIPVVGHVPTSVGLDAALESGQRSIEHLDGYLPVGGVPRVGTSEVNETVSAGAWNCPTLVLMDRFSRLDDPAQLESLPGLAYVDAETREKWNPANDFRLQSWTPKTFARARAQTITASNLVADLSRAGAHLILGTDTGNPYVIPGFAAHDELQLFVAAGLTPWQALRTATAAAAEFVERPGDFGVITPGARADLLVVDRDPLLDVGALEDPPLVLVRGRVLTKEQLLSNLKPNTR